MTTNLHDKMLAAIDAYFSASDAVEEEVAENLLLDVRDELLNQLAQRAWVGLTDEELIAAIYELEGFAFGLDNGNVSDGAVLRYARIVEAKLKEKNT